MTRASDAAAGLPYSVECPDCGAVCARTGLTTHRGTMGCSSWKATRAAEKRGLANVPKNWLGLLVDAGFAFEVIKTKPGTSDNPRLRDAYWADPQAVRLLKLTTHMDRKVRVVALGLMLRDDSLGKAIAYAVDTGDRIGLITFLEAAGHFPPNRAEQLRLGAFLP